VVGGGGGGGGNKERGAGGQGRDRTIEVDRLVGLPQWWREGGLSM